METDNKQHPAYRHPFETDALELCSGNRPFEGTVGALLLKMLLTILAILVLVVAITVTGGTVHAQQTVFNVPTTDVLDPGKVYFEMDISAKPNDSKFSSFVPRFVIGVGGSVEVGLNVLGNIQPGADSTTLAPAGKWRVYRNENASR